MILYQYHTVTKSFHIISLLIIQTEGLNLHIADAHSTVSSCAEDDRGVEGVVILPDSNKRKVRVGTKMATETGKTHEHESREVRDEQQAKNQAALVIASNTEELRVDVPHVIYVTCNV